MNPIIEGDRPPCGIQLPNTTLNVHAKTASDHSGVCVWCLEPEPRKSGWAKFKNCLTQCGSLAWIFCCPPCPWCVVHKVAFRPPSSTYRLKLSQDDTDTYKLEVSDELFRRVEDIPEEALQCLEAFYVKTKRGNKVLTLHYHCSCQPYFTILYCHGNAQDVGSLVLPVIHLSETLCCDVAAFDYSGYGKSSGSPSEKNMLADIEAVFEGLKKRYCLESKGVVIYGQSIGTVPAIHLASVQPDVGGLVLHSPLMSALRVFYPDKSERWCRCLDQFESIDRIQGVVCPTLIIHGTSDEVISFENGLRLHKTCPGSVSPLWIRGGHHNDLDCYRAYWRRMAYFIHHELKSSKHPAVVQLGKGTTTSSSLGSTVNWDTSSISGAGSSTNSMNKVVQALVSLDCEQREEAASFVNGNQDKIEETDEI